MVNFMKRLLVLLSTGLLLGCGAPPKPKPVLALPPSSQEQCVYLCLDDYAICILECNKTKDIGAELDNCVKQCKENWAECYEDCSEVGKLE